MKEFKKYLLAGISSTAIDFTVLNFLLVITGVRDGFSYSLIKAIAFLCAATNGYFWNKFWVFQKKGCFNWKEYIKFLSFASFYGFLDVLFSSLIVNFVSPPFDFITPLIWANISAALGSFPVTIFRFFSYKKIVFLK